MPKIEIPDKLLCPITYEMFKDPVVADDGHIYERDAIEKWVSEKGTSPKTREKISNKFTLSQDKKGQLAKFRDKNKLCTLEQFLAAVQSGNVVELEQLNYLDSYLEARDSRGETALHYAAERGHTEVVELLLEANARVDALTDYGETALYLAAARGHTAVVKLLLEANATVNATTLHGAAATGHAAVVKLLLGAHAKVDAQANNGWTALHWAAATGHAAVVKLLLESGANHKLVNDQGQTAVALAQKNGKADTAKLLVDYAQQLKVEARKAPQKIAELKEIIQQQQSLIYQLTEQVKELTEQLTANSFKSSASQAQLITRLSSLYSAATHTSTHNVQGGNDNNNVYRPS